MNEKLCKAKSLRRNATDTERFLWEFLRSNRLAKFKFRRQVPLGPYIADFVCQKQRVIVECGGGQHAQRQKTYDDERDQWLKMEGYRVLRFWNNQILKEHEAVLQVIYEACADTPHPTLSPKGRGGVKNGLFHKEIKLRAPPKGSGRKPLNSLSSYKGIKNKLTDNFVLSRLYEVNSRLSYD